MPPLQLSNPMPQIGLSCASLVRWLISAEPDIYKRVIEFIKGEADSVIEVAGPPTAEQILKRHKKKHQLMDLPLITLNLRKTRHHLTGQPGVEVRCSDNDLEEIVRWRREAHLRTMLTARVPN